MIFAVEADFPPCEKGSNNGVKAKESLCGTGNATLDCSSLVMFIGGNFSFVENESVNVIFSARGESSK